MPLGKTYSNPPNTKSQKMQDVKQAYAKRMAEMLAKAEEYSEPLSKEEMVKLCRGVDLNTSLKQLPIDINTAIVASVIVNLFETGQPLDVSKMPLYMHVAIRQIYKLEEQQVADL